MSDCRIHTGGKRNLVCSDCLAEIDEMDKLNRVVCPACRRAKKIRGYVNTEGWVATVNEMYACHLEKDHCTCED